MRLLEYLLEYTNVVVNEGGAAGHMLHPFQLDKIAKCTDIIGYFNDLASFLEKGGGASLKIDGTNCSIRMVERNGMQTFVLDRLTKDEDDIKGMTSDDIERKYSNHPFNYGHYAKTTLNCFNECLPHIMPLLKKLGVADNPNIMLNVEFVDGKTNVVEFDRSFIAIHGLLEITTTPSGYRKTKEIRGNSGVIDAICKKMTRLLEGKSISVVSQVPAILKRKPDFNKVLNSDFTVVRNGEKETKPLINWMNEYDSIKKGATVVLNDGKRIQATAITNIKRIAAGEDLSKIAPEKYWNNLLSGFFMMYSTLMLGKELNAAMDTVFGDCAKQEGIVIRDEQINGTDAPVKVTGDFIFRIL